MTRTNRSRKRDVPFRWARRLTMQHHSRPTNGKDPPCIRNQDIAVHRRPSTRTLL